MKHDKITFFLPARKGSQRVKHKNTRLFAGIKGGLLANKLQQLLKTQKIDEIVLSSNDEECLFIAEQFRHQDKRIVIDVRPDALCLDSTNLSDLIAYVPSVVSGKHIMWGHVTTPLADAKIYDRAVEAYFDALGCGYDSLVSVVELRNFLLDKTGRQVNNTTGILWPRTQDLEPLYELNHVLFVAPVMLYKDKQNRIGGCPKMFVMDKLMSMDVDWEEDFIIAEMMYRMLRGDAVQ